VWPHNWLQGGIQPPSCPQDSSEWTKTVVAAGDPAGTSSSRGTANSSGCSAGSWPAHVVPSPTWAFAPAGWQGDLKHRQVQVKVDRVVAQELSPKDGGLVINAGRRILVAEGTPDHQGEQLWHSWLWQVWD
jgi:hypothetical protein